MTTTDESGTVARAWTLRAGGYVAVVDPIGASLASLRHEGRDLVVPYPAGTLRPLYRGALLAPWPNRVVDGRYQFGGVRYELPLNERERGHALHGLVQWVRWDALRVAEDRVEVGHRLVPQDGYPFALDLRATFVLGADGLTTVLRVRNVGDGPAPYGCAPHPYLVAGPGRVDDWRLTLPAGRRLEVDDRLAPTHTVEVDDVDARFTDRRLRGIALDHAFTDLERDDDGRARVRVVVDADGPVQPGVEMSWGPWGPWVQVHTAERPEPEDHRVGLAVEPMTCPPDAFNSGTDLVVLGPGDEHEAEWVIRALP
jgi:aldose 1-epimerase